MRGKKSDEKGFTLIEVIVTLMLVGITAVLAGMWIVSVANGYVFAKLNARTAQNGQLAMTRLVKEFAAITSVDEGTTNTNINKITYTRTDSALAPVSAIVSLSGKTIQMNIDGAGANTLTDSVSSFTLAYCDDPNSPSPSCSQYWSSTSRIIEIKLTLTGGNNTPVEFAQRVAPRNL